MNFLSVVGSVVLVERFSMIFIPNLFISVIYEMYVRVDRVSKMCELNIYMAITVSVWNKNDDV